MTRSIWSKKQLTSLQAFLLEHSGETKKLTSNQVVGLQLFQRCLCVDLERFAKAVDVVFGRKIESKMYATEELQREFLQTNELPDLDQILAKLPAGLLKKMGYERQ